MRTSLLLIATLFAGVALPAERMEQPVAVLVKQLQAGNLAERRQAAAALGDLGPKAAAATPALIEALKDWRTRKAAAEALMRVGPTAAEAVLELAKREREAYEIFAGMKPAPMEIVLPMLKSRDVDICRGAFTVLSYLGEDGVAAIPSLIEIIRRPPVLERLGSEEATRLVLRDDPPESKQARSCGWIPKGQNLFLPSYIKARWTNAHHRPLFLDSLISD